VVGDSLTVGTEAFGLLSKKVDALGTWTSVKMDAKVGRKASLGASVIEKGLTASTTAVVIALGTNDIGKYATSEEYGALVTLVVDVLPDDTPLVWVDAFRDDYVDDSTLFNEALRAQLSDRDGTVVVERAHDDLHVVGRHRKPDRYFAGAPESDDRMTLSQLEDLVAASRA
jgi:hypothetical protein